MIALGRADRDMVAVGRPLGERVAVARDPGEVGARDVEREPAMHDGTEHEVGGG